MKLFLAVIVSATFVCADEGMWTFDNPPTKLIQDEVSFHADAKPGWITFAWRRRG